MRKFLIVAWLLIISSAILGLFWYCDWQYRQPTPVPVGYRNVAVGTLININEQTTRPLFLHFYNPSCACSRFNLPTFHRLVAAHQRDLTFIVVLPDQVPLSVIDRDMIGKHTIIIHDHGLARQCGVYSTPQVVLLDHNRRLFYRGNYNISRYCNDERTNFASRAIDAMFTSGLKAPDNHLALQAYGCGLTACFKTKN